MTDDTTTTEAPDAQENVFNGVRGLRVHASSVLASAFNDRMSHVGQSAHKRITDEVDDFIEAVDKLARYLSTGEK